MSDPSQVGFEELQIFSGQNVSLFPNPKGSASFEAVYVGTLLDEAVILTAREGSEFPVIKEGQSVLIKVLSVNGLAVFASQVLFVSEEPAFMVYLDHPQRIQYKPVRGATRVDVILPVLASSKGGNRKNTVGKIVDISATGARMILADPIAKPGEKIDIKGKFTVATIKRILKMQAIVRAVRPVKDEFSFGVEFADDEEDNRLVLFGFIFHAMSFGRIQNIK